MDNSRNSGACTIQVVWCPDVVGWVKEKERREGETYRDIVVAFIVMSSSVSVLSLSPCHCVVVASPSGSMRVQRGILTL